MELRLPPEQPPRRRSCHDPLGQLCHRPVHTPVPFLKRRRTITAQGARPSCCWSLYSISFSSNQLTAMNKSTVQAFIDAQNNLVVQHSDFSLRALFDMANNTSIDLKPHYQRRDRWKPEKQSALIESFTLNVPVPPVLSVRRRLWSVLGY